jgi:Cytochrome P450.
MENIFLINIFILQILQKYFFYKIQETQRLCNLLPINLDRRVTKDVEIAGFKLPEGSTLIPQVATVLYDEKVRAFTIIMNISSFNH